MEGTRKGTIYKAGSWLQDKKSLKQIVVKTSICREEREIEGHGVENHANNRRPGYRETQGGRTGEVCLIGEAVLAQAIPYVAFPVDVSFGTALRRRFRAGRAYPVPANRCGFPYQF
jgi:hypothetical protein